MRRGLIEKGAWRVALERWEEMRFSAGGFVHLGCAPTYAEVDDIKATLSLLPGGWDEAAEASA